MGHSGTTPGLNFVYAHMNRVIRNWDLNAIYVMGPGHGGRDVGIEREPRKIISGEKTFSAQVPVGIEVRASARSALLEQSKLLVCLGDVPSFVEIGRAVAAIGVATRLLVACQHSECLFA